MSLSDDPLRSASGMPVAPVPVAAVEPPLGSASHPDVQAAAAAALAPSAQPPGGSAPRFMSRRQKRVEDVALPFIVGVELVEAGQEDEVIEREFIFHPRWVPGTVGFDAMAAQARDRISIHDFDAVWKVYETGLGGDGYREFRAFVDDPKVNIELEQIGETLAWMLKEINGVFPTEQPAP